MIPWASFLDRKPSYTDFVFPLSESNLRSHTGTPEDLLQQFDDRSMLVDAFERRFALSQFDHSRYNLVKEHTETVDCALNHLSTFFYQNAPFMPSPRVHSSTCENDLAGLTMAHVKTMDIPEYNLEDAFADMPDTTITPTWYPSLSRSRSPPPDSHVNPSTRLSISSLIHHCPPTSAATTMAQATTPITVDSELTPNVFDKSYPNISHSSESPDLDSEKEDFDDLYHSPDDHVISTLRKLVRTRTFYATAIPFSNPTRMHKTSRMRRSSRSRPSHRHHRPEEVRKAMEAEDDSRRRDMKEIEETWRVMKRKEAEDEGRLRLEKEARSVSREGHNEWHDESNEKDTGGGKRVKLEQQQRPEQRQRHYSQPSDDGSLSPRGLIGTAGGAGEAASRLATFLQPD